MKLPLSAQTEQLDDVRERFTDLFAVPLTGASVNVSNGAIRSGLASHNLPTADEFVQNNTEVFFVVNNLLRFYGKAAPEALDKWQGILHA